MLLTDVDQNVAGEIVANYLNSEFYSSDSPITNRMLHSQQVMLLTGLACKNRDVRMSMENTLTSMAAALFHDIGHVPLAHIMERAISESEGFFSHEANGKRIINKILNENIDVLIQKMKRYYPDKTNQEIKQSLTEKNTQIANAVEQHSRTNSEQRGKGPIEQLPRSADKISYMISDIRDLALFYGIHIEEMLSDKKSYDINLSQKSVTRFFHEYNCELDGFTTALKKGDFGRAAVTAIQSMDKLVYDGKIYYNVDEDIWDFIINSIKKTSEVRKNTSIEKVSEKLKKVADFVLTKVTNKHLKRLKGDKEEARIAGIDEITRMGEPDLIAFMDKYIGKATTEQLKGTAPIETEQVDRVKRAFAVMLREHHPKEADQLIAELMELPAEEALKLFAQYDSISQGEIDAISKIKQTEDVQIKIRPTQNIQIYNVLLALGMLEGDTEVQRIHDDYLEMKDKKDTLRLRHIDGEEKQTLTYKKAVPKNVKETTYRRYETSGDNSLSIEEMIAKLNQENPGLNLEWDPSKDKKKTSLMITRMLFPREYKDGNKVTISNDIAVDAYGRVLNEIEIKCPESKKTIRKIKEDLQAYFGKKIVFSQTQKSNAFRGDQDETR